MLRSLGTALAVCIALLVCSAPAAAQRISMAASSNRVAVGEPFAVEIRVDIADDEPDSLELPDFGQLEVLSRSQARPMSFSLSFGSGGQHAQVKKEIIYNFTLRAPSRGAYNISPAVMMLRKKRYATQAINIIAAGDVPQGQGAPSMGGLSGQDIDPDERPARRVAPPSGLDGATYDPTMFLRTVVDKKKAYVGEQVTVTVYLYLHGQLPDNPNITREPTLEGFWSQDLMAIHGGLPPVRHDANGRPFNAYVIRRFAAFPLRPGKLDIGAPSVELSAGGSIFDLMNGAPQALRRNGVKVSIDVLPLPAQPTAGAPTYTGTLEMDATLEPSEAKVGDGVTLKVSMKGSGNLRALSLPTPKLPGLETLSPEVDDEVTADGDTIGGQRVVRWLMLPREAGTRTIPAFAVDVLDPATGKFTTVRTQPLPLTITGKSEAAPAAAAASASAIPDQNAARFGPVRTESALRRASPELRTRAWFWPSVGAAPLLVFLLSGLRLVRRAQAKRRAGNRGLQALREVDERLDKAAQAVKAGDARAALGLLGSAIKGALEARLKEPVGGLTMSALETHLRARGMEDKLTGRVIGQLGALESARFDPTAQGAVQVTRAMEGVRALIAELSRFRPKPAPAARRTRIDDAHEEGRT